MSVGERSREADGRAQAVDEYRSAPPAGEEIHLPGPTLLPLISAIGITLIVIGTTIDWIWSAVGGVLFIVAAIIWIRDTRRNVAELPEEHRH